MRWQGCTRPPAYKYSLQYKSYKDARFQMCSTSPMTTSTTLDQFTREEERAFFWCVILSSPVFENSFKARGICVKRVQGHVLAFLRTPTRFIFIIKDAIEDYHRDRVSPRISTFDANDHEITKKNVSLAIPEMLPIWQNVARNESTTVRSRLSSAVKTRF